MRLTGTLLKVEDYAGTMTGDDGREFTYSGTRLHILDGVEVVKAKMAKDAPLPAAEPGDAVDLRVTVTANSGARNAYLSIQCLGEWADEPALSF